MTVPFEILGPKAQAFVALLRAEQAARAERERIAALSQTDINRLQKAEQTEIRKLFLALGAAFAPAASDAAASALVRAVRGTGATGSLMPSPDAATSLAVALPGRRSSGHVR